MIRIDEKYINNLLHNCNNAVREALNELAEK